MDIQLNLKGVLVADRTEAIHIVCPLSQRFLADNTLATKGSIIGTGVGHFFFLPGSR